MHILHETECARGCDIIACAAGNKSIGSESARRETDRPVTDLGWSCEKSVDSNHWSIGASLGFTIKMKTLKRCCVIIHKKNIIKL